MTCSRLRSSQHGLHPLNNPYMKVLKKIKLSTYSCSVTFMVTDDVIEKVNSIYKKSKLNDTFSDVVEGVVLSFDMDNYYLIISSQYLTHDTIAHEVYHAAVRVSEDRDVTDEEAQAWLAGYITGEIYKFLQKKNLPIKHGRG